MRWVSNCISVADILNQREACALRKELEEREREKAAAAEAAMEGAPLMGGLRATAQSQGSGPAFMPA
eukprot:3208106-Amphidinium_carterae.1